MCHMSVVKTANGYLAFCDIFNIATDKCAVLTDYAVTRLVKGSWDCKTTDPLDL